MHPGMPFILEDDSSSIGSLVGEEFQRLATEVSWHLFKNLEYMCWLSLHHFKLNMSWCFRIVLHKTHDDLKKFCLHFHQKKPWKTTGNPQWLWIEAETALKEIKGAWGVPVNSWFTNGARSLIEQMMYCIGFKFYIIYVHCMFVESYCRVFQTAWWYINILYIYIYACRDFQQIPFGQIISAEICQKQFLVCSNWTPIIRPSTFL